MYNEFANIANEMGELFFEAEVLNFNKNILNVLQENQGFIKNYATSLFYLKELVNANKKSIEINGKLITQESCKEELSKFCQQFLESNIYKDKELDIKQIQSLLGEKMWFF